jgi:hypothetical protein
METLRSLYRDLKPLEISDVVSILDTPEENSAEMWKVALPSLPWEWFAPIPYRCRGPKVPRYCAFECPLNGKRPPRGVFEANCSAFT